MRYFVLGLGANAALLRLLWCDYFYLSRRRARKVLVILVVLGTLLPRLPRQLNKTIAAKLLVPAMVARLGRSPVAPKCLSYDADGKTRMSSPPHGVCLFKLWSKLTRYHLG